MICLFGHKWNGCKCEKCGKTRDEQHDWDLCKGKCKRCGTTQTEQHDWDGNKCSSCGKVKELTLDDIKRLNVIIEPFLRQENGFYDESLEQDKKNALKKVIKEGVTGEKFLLDFLLRDVTIIDGNFKLNYYGDSANTEWNKKRDIVLMLAGTSDNAIINKLAEILMLKGLEQQYWTVFQPAVAETLGFLKQYNVLEKYVKSGQNVPAVWLSKDILRLHKAGVTEKEENIRDENGNTPLHNAVRAKDITLVKKLLESGADVDVCSRNEGETALYTAVDRESFEIVKLLVEYKANLSATDFNLTFPLQRAAAMGAFDIAKLLVDNGADKQQKTLSGKTALMWAEQNEHANIAALLK